MPRKQQAQKPNAHLQMQMRVLVQNKSIKSPFTDPLVYIRRLHSHTCQPVLAGADKSGEQG